MKNLHDIIQKNMEEFEKTFPSIKDVAEKVGEIHGVNILISLKSFFNTCLIDHYEEDIRELEGIMKDREFEGNYQKESGWDAALDLAISLLQDKIKELKK